MTITQLIEMLQRRLCYLGQLRSGAESLGDIARVGAVEADISETQVTLDALKSIGG